MTKNSTKKIPRLRFKGFEGEWEEKKLGDVSLVFDGVHQTPKYKTNGIPFMSVENLKRLSTKKYISKDAFEKDFKNNRPQKGDILMSRIGSIGEDNIIKDDSPVAFYVSLASIRPQKRTVSSFYLLYLIRSPKFQNELWKRTLHVAFPKKINKNEISKIKTAFPNLNEQEKIGSFFAKLDQLIDLQSKKVEQLKKLKRGYLQKMFPQKGESVPRLRFDGFGSEWKECKISDIFKVSRGHVLSLDKISNYKTKKNIYPVYSSQTKDNGLLGYYSQYLFNNAITWTTDGANAGTTKFRKGKFFSTNVNGTLFSKNGYSNIAVAEIINSISFKYVSHVGNPKLMSGVMSDIKIKIASLKELSKISQLIEALDNTINYNNKKVNSLNNLKKAYLQKLFI